MERYLQQMKNIIPVLLTILLLSCSSSVQEKKVENTSYTKASITNKAKTTDSTVLPKVNIEETTYKPLKIEISEMSNQEVDEFIDNIPNKYEIIKELITSSNKDSIQKNNSALLVKCTPCVEFEKYSFIIYPKTENQYFERFKSRHSIQLPKEYKDFLKSINGCKLYGISLFGLTPSIYKNEIGLLDRSVFQCIDIGISNSFYKQEYNLKDTSYLMFGSGTYSYSENIGYFWNLKSNQIKIIRASGEELHTYKDFNSFLNTEIPKSKEVLDKIRLEKESR